VFHLTRYKYIFFLISGLVILPGLLALIVWGLNLGTDFTGGTLAELRFAKTGITTEAITKAFVDAHAKDVKVFALGDINTTAQNPAQYAFITLSRPIDTDTRAEVMKRLSDSKAGLPAPTLDGTDYDVSVDNGPHTAQLVVYFAGAITADKVKAALQNLPDTGNPPSGTGDTTAAPTATANPKVTPSPAPTATPVTKFKVSVADITLGANSTSYQVDTQATFKGNALADIVYKLAKDHGPAYVRSKSEIGGAIGQETTFYAILAVIFSSLFIMLYIAIAFRKVGSWQRSLRFGVSAILALLHDVLVVLGLWAIFGRLFDFKVDSLFLTAILTVVGFSVHDTIVVFDRIRENLQRRTTESFTQIVDASLIQTLTRSLNTSLTVVITLTALTLFGGPTIREFTLALLIGVVSGTFSSIFNASMILTVWETGEWRTWFGRKAAPAPKPAARALAGSRA
jgi:preprotein translocase SecF subunit